MQGNIPERVVIAGGGTAGWMTAMLMQQAWQARGTEIVLIESSRLGTVGVGEGSTPFLRDFFKKLNIAEQEWMPACNATYKCGISFPGWCKEPEKTYFHPFYSALDTENALKFFDNCNHRRSGHGVPSHPDLYFVTAELARQQKAPVPQRPLPFEHDYGYHFDAELLGQFLSRRACAGGVRRIDTTIEQVVVNDLGNIDALQLESGETLRADVFVDCTGFKSLLMKQALGQRFIDYSDALFNDSAVAMPTALPQTNTLASETISKALSHGWVWHIPLTNRIGNGYVYSSKYLSADQAESQLREQLGADKNTKAIHLRWQPGRLQQNWQGNCFAAGLAQGFLEPLEAAMLHTIQHTAESFIKHYESGGSGDRDEHNRKVNVLIDGTRDYIQLHYLLNSREDSDYWRDLRANSTVSEDLQALLQAWDNNRPFEETMAQSSNRQVYKRTSWYCMLAGMERYPVATKTPKGSLSVYIERLQQHCRQRADVFYDHYTFIQQQAKRTSQQECGNERQHP